ncbi:MAG: DUF86 domain-containing protein [Streptosporangiales bacterium]|nr:DUF86 domain-containing protein [Streptosporangiales bacterium]MBO0889356.1 DUF86 domain-containing protein [Acidothermales bacterium]
MLDEARLFWRLHAVTVEVAVLRAEATADQARRGDPLWLRGTKYAYLTAIECCADVVQHVCAEEGWGRLDDDGDAMRSAGEHGLLPGDLAASMRRLVAFRDTLVHRHLDADDQLTERLSDLDALDAFVAAVAEFTERRAGEG